MINDSINNMIWYVKFQCCHGNVPSFWFQDGSQFIFIRNLSSIILKGNQTATREFRDKFLLLVKIGVISRAFCYNNISITRVRARIARVSCAYRTSCRAITSKYYVVFSERNENKTVHWRRKHKSKQHCQLD
jgi:hypothetical protein